MNDTTRRPGVARLFRALVALVSTALLLSVGACVSLTPYDAVRDSASGRFVRLGSGPSEQWVHLEDEGDGEPVFLLHGFAGSSFTWRHVIPELADSYRVIAPDLNGHGFTQRPETFKSYTGTGQLRLLLDLMDALDIESAHFVGLSYGGALSLTLAHRYPEKVRSLTLVDSAHPSYIDGRRRNVAAVKPLLSLYLHTRALTPDRVRLGLERSIYDDDTITDEQVEGYLARLKVEGATRAYRYLTGPVPSEEPPVDFRDIHVPALALWGEEDELIPVERGRAAAERLPELRRFVTLEETGHLPPEEAPERVAEEIRRFLTEVGAEDHRARTAVNGDRAALRP